MAEKLMNQLRSIAYAEFRRGNSSFPFCGQIAEIRHMHRNEYGVFIAEMEIIRIIDVGGNLRMEAA